MMRSDQKTPYYQFSFAPNDSQIHKNLMKSPRHFLGEGVKANKKGVTERQRQVAAPPAMPQHWPQNRPTNTADKGEKATLWRKDAASTNGAGENRNFNSYLTPYTNINSNVIID